MLFGAYEVWIEVDGEKLEEFELDDYYMGEIPFLTCHIPSEVGKQFRIGCTIPLKAVKRENHDISVSIDGRYIGLKYSMFPKDPRADEDVTEYFELDVLKNGNARTFEFGDLQFTDDDAMLGMEGNEMGTIQVKLRQYGESKRNKKPKKSGSARISNWKAPPGNDIVHERSKKGLTHCVKFGEEKPYKKSKGTSVYETLFDEEDFCEFQFVYRSMGKLAADGIAPPLEPETSDVPIPTPDPSNSVVAEDASSSIANSAPSPPPSIPNPVATTSSPGPTSGCAPAPPAPPSDQSPTPQTPTVPAPHSPFNSARPTPAPVASPTPQLPVVDLPSSPPSAPIEDAACAGTIPRAPSSLTDSSSKSSNSAEKRKHSAVKEEDSTAVGARMLNSTLEMQKLDARLAALRKVEAEVLAQRDRLRTQVKQEPNSSSLAPGEVIDLTEGDEPEPKVETVECKCEELKKEEEDIDIKPRSASPSMIDEVRKLRDQLALLERQLVKEEEGSEPSLKRVKREQSGTLVPGEVIDLTL